MNRESGQCRGRRRRATSCEREWACSIYACGWAVAQWRHSAPGFEMGRSQPFWLTGRAGTRKFFSTIFCATWRCGKIFILHNFACEPTLDNPTSASGVRSTERSDSRRVSGQDFRSNSTSGQYFRSNETTSGAPEAVNGSPVCFLQPAFREESACVFEGMRATHNTGQNPHSLQKVRVCLKVCVANTTQVNFMSDKL